MQEYEHRIVEKKEAIETIVRCDVCNKVLIDRRIVNSYGKRLYYFRVTTGHSDWGNDSCDSVDHRDICIDCLPVCFLKYVDNKDKNETGFIEMNRESGWIVST